MNKEKKKAYNKQYHLDNKDRAKRYSKQYHIDNKEKTAAYQKQYRIDNKDKAKRYSKQYHIDNKEKHNAKCIQYVIDNKEEIKQYMKQYYAENKEEIKQYSRQWYKDNKEHKKQYDKQYREDNRASFCLSRAKYKSSKLDQTPELNDNDELVIKLLYGVSIQWNERYGSGSYHVDHIIPLSKGGLHEPYNLQVVPATENLQKNDSLTYTIPRELCFRIDDLIEAIKDKIEISKAYNIKKLSI